MITGRRPRSTAPAWLLVGSLAATPALAAVQTPTGPSARRIGTRLRALEDEADRLAAESRAALDAIRAAEAERDRQVTAAARARAERQAASQDLALLRERLTALRQTDALDEPLIAARLVALYKHGRGSYLRLLFGGETLQDVGRAARTISSLLDQNAQRIRERLDAIAAAEHEERLLLAHLAERDAAVAAAEAARDAAADSLLAREAAMAALDRKRDTNAQMLGALRAPGGPDGAATPPPILAFKGALDWPVVGPVVTRFRARRPGAASPLANGITIGAPAGTPVVAVHDGRVTYAEPFAGLGTLVMVDHGGGVSSAYGLLRSTPARRDQRVLEGDTLGAVAESSAGGRPALYFEIRAGGQPADPIQWLRPR